MKSRLLARRLALAAVPLLGIVGCELALRGAGRPRGTYRAYIRLQALAADGTQRRFLHRPGEVQALKMFAEPYQYTLRINALGLRGREVAPAPPPGTFRIVCVGDSITDGMYVSDPYSFPGQLDARYQETGRAVEVLNLGEPGAGIHRELELLRTIGLPLSPSLVLLSFVTNDLFDVGEEQELAREGASARTPPAAAGWREWLLVHSALAEWAMDRYLLSKASSARREETVDLVETGSKDQVELEENGTRRGAEFASNAAKFRERHRVADDRVIGEDLAPDVLAEWQGYRLGLEGFANAARGCGVPVAVVFVPAYPQIYEDPPGRALQRLLAEECARLELPFLDLTDDLRAERDQVLHFAPIDYHFTRRGNRVLAGILMRRLDEQNLVPK